MITQRPNLNGAAHNSPSMIVIHAMGEYIVQDDGSAMYAPDFLEAQKLSAHALVAPSGEIIRCRNDEQGAYHAKGFNTNSLGLEVLASGKLNYGMFAKAIYRSYVTPAQYQVVLDQCREWMKLHKITSIVRHSDLSPGRKIDPGQGFPWGQLLIDLKWRKA